jgi:hypothetical protein
MLSQNDFKEQITKDLQQDEILHTTEVELPSDFSLKPKTKPKRNLTISDEERKRRAEQLKKLNEKRSDDAAERKEVELTFKEKAMKEKLRVLEEKKKEVKARNAAKKKEEAPKAEPKAEPKPEPIAEPKKQKKPKKAVKVVVETSSDSSEYSSSGDSGSSDESEVIFISKKKKPTKVKDQPLTKAKEEPPTPAIKLLPPCVFKFV